jgi:hypothetical protein
MSGQMAASAPTPFRRAWLVCAALLLVAGQTPAQILPWEITVAEIESGRLRGLVQRLAKQNLLYQLRLAEVTKEDLVETAARIDRVLFSLEKGSPSYSIPAPWTTALREQVAKVDGLWGPLRRIAVASAYDTFRVSREYVPADDRRGDPLLLRYFDGLALKLIEESEKLLGLYQAECLKTDLGVCDTAQTSGYGAMLIERAAKEAVYVVAGIDAEQNNKRLNATIEAYQALRLENQQSPFFAEALDPDRGLSAQAAGELLMSLRSDWDAMQDQFAILAAGDLANFDLQRMLGIHTTLVEKVERLTAALVRYASLTYGS